ncbi:HNH endonuclease signature motif containing protein [Bacillus sp. SJS]|uniref:HNH endonuclease n=1 Tax=Bacillus sp. SJS TaxID=1423321 RepID=UPI0009EF4AA6
MCNITDPKLLITSHIKTWSASTVQERVDLSNAILLCKLHDGLFENGNISLTDDYDLLYSPTYNFEEQLISTDITFRLPIKNYPLNVYLAEHRLKHEYE